MNNEALEMRYAGSVTAGNFSFLIGNGDAVTLDGGKVRGKCF
jgi:hypothetical protein